MHRVNKTVLLVNFFISFNCINYENALNYLYGQFSNTNLQQEIMYTT